MVTTSSIDDDAQALCGGGGGVVESRPGLRGFASSFIGWLRAKDGYGAPMDMRTTPNTLRCVSVGVGGLIGILVAAWLVSGTMSCSRGVNLIADHARVQPPTVDHDPDQSPTSFEKLQREYFPQTLQCGSWHGQYAQMHADVIAGRRAPRFFVSVAAQTGIADRLVGMITQLYIAILSDRAFTATTYDDIPSFTAACASPFLNWTHPTALPDNLITPLRVDFKGKHSYNASSVDMSHYASSYTVNNAPYKVWQSGNLSKWPVDVPEVPYLIGASNRGRSFAIANNPHHRSRFWRMGIRPETAFLCGAFFLCAPNEAVQKTYRGYWDVLKDDSTLKIAINVRLGESVFKGELEYNATNRGAILDKASGYFDCAAKIEKAFALPGQKVIWVLMSDSLLVRKAAADEYGAKVLTDLERKPVHPDCRTYNPTECQNDVMNKAMVDSIGQLYTFSMADYHILPINRGFGRVGAWLSGHWKNIYELTDGKASCDPQEPTTPEASAVVWAGI